MDGDYQNEDYQRDNILEKLSHASEACSELRKAGSLPVSDEETQEYYEYVPDPAMLMRKLPKKGLKTQQDLFASGIDKLKEWCRSPINFAYVLALLSLIMAVVALILAFHRCFPSCPFEWYMFKEKCYFYVPEKVNWTNARRICQDLDADLVVIGSEEEQDFLVYNIPVKNSYWIGYSDFGSKKTWKWVDGSDSAYTYWAFSEPSDKDEKNCAALAKENTYMWNVLPCYITDVLVICEKHTQLACVWHLLHNSFN